MDHSIVKIFDTTLRDGEQAPGNSMNLAEKVRMARQLERLGVDVIEAGFPIASPDDFAAVKEIAAICERATVCGLARAMEKDIRRAGEALQGGKKTRIHTFVSTSPLHMKYQIRKTPDEVLAMTWNAVSLAHSLCADVEFSPMDATRSDEKFLYEVLACAIECGATTLNIPDTVGYIMPEEYEALIRGIIAHVPGIQNVIISTHCHNDLGLAVANSLAGVRGGARQVECAINGIGERAGNASLEEVVMALTTRKEFFGLHSNAVTTELYPTSRLLTSITGVPVQPNKAIIGANAFAHESGIHQDGVLKERTTYEIMQAEDVGKTGNAIILGKHSGRHALISRLKQLGYALTAEEIDALYERFVRLADKKKRIFDEDLMLLMQQGDEGQHEFTLKELTVTSSTVVKPCATVVLTDPKGTDRRGEGTGDGPVSSMFNAIESIVGLPNTLVHYSVSALTEGNDALGTVAVQIRTPDGRVVSGDGSDTDILVASAKAYLAALNRVLAFQKIKPRMEKPMF